MEKLEWLGYQTVKNIEDIFIRFGATHERDGRTDGQTPGDDARLCIASAVKTTHTLRRRGFISLYDLHTGCFKNVAP